MRYLLTNPVLIWDKSVSKSCQGIKLSKFLQKCWLMSSPSCPAQCEAYQNLGQCCGWSGPAGGELVTRWDPGEQHGARLDTGRTETHLLSHIIRELVGHIRESGMDVIGKDQTVVPKLFSSQWTFGPWHWN